MSESPLARLARRLGAAAVDPTTTDRDLLDCFLTAGDDAAFEALVRRHERTVRAAVGRVLADPHDAADAAQATFLVLVRRAGQLDHRADLGPWLYGVAHRIAVRARADRMKRARNEARVRQTEPAPAPDPSWREACDLLHAELDRLPDRYRLPVLLCYLEGKTRDEAATALGLSVGTVKGRVRRGCDLLRGRLARRGVTLSAGLLSAVAAAPSAAVSPDFAAGVVEAAKGAASARVTQLVGEAVMGAMLLKVTAGIGAALAATGAAAWLLAGGPPAPTPRPAVPAVAAKPAESDAEVRDRLANLWKRQGELMRRGRFEVLLVRTSLGGKMTRDELHRRLAGLDAHAAPQFLQQLLDIEGPPPPGVTRAALHPIEVRADGSRRLEKRLIDGLDPPAYWVMFTDGRSYVEYEPRNKQAAAYDPYITVLGIGDLRHLPIPSGEQLHPSWQVVDRAGGRITLRHSVPSYSMELEADERTGFVYSNRMESAKGAVITIDGPITEVHEWLQIHPTTDAAGRVMPALRVEATYSDGKLTLIDAVHVLKAEWDAPLTDADFAIAVPAKTYVHDHRGHHDNPKGRSAAEAVPDLLKFADAIPDENRQFWPILAAGSPAPKLDPAVWLPREGAVGLPDMAGRVVLIDFWSLDCGPCIGELPELRAAVDKHRDTGLLIVGLHAAGYKAAKVSAFAEEHKLTHPLAIDRKDKDYFGATFRAYGVHGVPAAALIDREGRIVSVGRFKDMLTKAEELLAADKK